MAHVPIAYESARAEAQTVCYKHNFIILFISLGVRR